MNNRIAGSIRLKSGVDSLDSFDNREKDYYHLGRLMTMAKNETVRAAGCGYEDVTLISVGISLVEDNIEIGYEAEIQ